MISMEMMGKIRRMYFRDKLSLHEIAKRTGLARNTIRKWVRAPEAKPPVYQRRAIFNKLSPFHATLEQALKADSLRPKQQRRSAKALLAQIKAEGYDGGYSQLTAFIRAWRGGQGKASQAFVPLTFALGEAFQFDWSEEGLLVGGIYRRMQVAHLKLCASRAFWLVAYPSQGHEMLFDAHTRSFGALGGVPRRGIYDNMKTAVDKVNKGKGRAVNARFAVMCAHYLFDPDFCNVAAGWEKGIVEKNVQDSRRRIWLDAQDCQFHSFEELNAWLGRYGIQPQDDRVLAARSTPSGIDKQFAVDARFLENSPITQALMNQATLLPRQTRSIKMLTGLPKQRDENIQTVPLLTPSEIFWGERDFEDALPQYNEKEENGKQKDNGKPLYVAAALERGAASDPRLQMQSSRLVVVGNSGLAEPPVSAPNYDFLTRSLNWMLHRDVTSANDSSTDKLFKIRPESPNWKNNQWDHKQQSNYCFAYPLIFSF